MKKNVLIAIGFLFSEIVFSQGTIVSYSIEPTSPTTADYVKVYVNEMFTSGGCPLDTKNHTTSGLTTTAYAHHCLGMLAFICNAVDTFNLGFLQQGNHTFQMTLTSGSGGPGCTAGIVPDDTSSSHFNVSLALGVKTQLLDESMVSIYPNPTNGQFTLNMNKYYSSIKVEITNLLGEHIYDSYGKETNTLPLQLYVPDGLYIVSITTNEGILKKKIVIQ